MPHGLAIAPDPFFPIQGLVHGTTAAFIRVLDDITVLDPRHAQLTPDGFQG